MSSEERTPPQPSNGSSSLQSTNTSTLQYGQLPHTTLPMQSSNYILPLHFQHMPPPSHTSAALSQGYQGMPEYQPNMQAPVQGLQYNRAHMGLDQNNSNTSSINTAHVQPAEFGVVLTPPNSSPTPNSDNSNVQLEHLLNRFWQQQLREIQEQVDFKLHNLPLARIKRIMKSDEDVRMISQEAPILFAKACELFILELTLRAWVHTEESRRKILQRSDIALAVSKNDAFDFLIDIVPREDIKSSKSRSPSDSAHAQHLHPPPPSHLPPQQRLSSNTELPYYYPSYSPLPSLVPPSIASSIPSSIPSIPSSMPPSIPPPVPHTSLHQTSLHQPQLPPTALPQPQMPHPTLPQTSSLAQTASSLPQTALPQYPYPIRGVLPPVYNLQQARYPPMNTQTLPTISSSVSTTATQTDNMTGSVPVPEPDSILDNLNNSDEPESTNNTISDY